MSAKTACVDGDGKVVGDSAQVMVFSEDGSDMFDPEANVAPVPTDAKGNWTVTVTINAKAEDGDQYLVSAVCFDSDAAVDDLGSYIVYEPEVFTVAPVATAPPVAPVPGEPKFTG